MSTSEDPSLIHTSSGLGAFAHLPEYEFDFDYRGHTMRPHLNTLHPTFPNPLVDDFDSYMFSDPNFLSSVDDSIRNEPLPSDVSSRKSRSTPPSESSPRPIDWQAVDHCTLFSPDNALLEPDKLYTGYSKLVVLVFVPRHAIELCALVYGKVAHLLQQAGARLVFITPWQPAQSLTFLSRFEKVSTFPGSIVCDPDAALFTAFALTRSPFRALFSSSKVSAPMRQGMRNAFSTVTYRAQNRDIASTPVSSKRLKCGAVVFPSLRGYDKRPVISYMNEESPSTGVGCYLDVLAACGVNEAFVPEIDVSQVYSRFNSMRVARIKEKTAHEKELNRARSQKQRSSRKLEKRNALKPS